MGVRFPLKEWGVEVSDNMIRYNKWRIYYYDLADKGAEKYISEFYKKYDGLDGFSKYGLAGGRKVIQEAVSETIQLCVDAKIYDIDEERFMKKYGQSYLSPWEDAFEEINDKYMEIVLKAEDLDEYRAQRKASRARIIGGGFGFEGAMKGMMAAGAINIATGVVHGAFNLIGKGIDMIGNSMKKSSIYGSDDTRSQLYLGIWRSIFRMHFAICDIFGIPTLPNESKEKADILFKNIGRMPKDEVPKNIVDIINLYPYHIEAYKYWVENYGDSERQIQKIADNFGIDLEKVKNSLLEKEFSNLDLTTEESALEAKAKLQPAIIKYGILKSPLLKKIEDKLAAFDEKARTASSGVVYATREEANEASKEFERMFALIKELDLNTAQGIKRAISVIEQEDFSTSRKNEFIEGLTEILGEKQEKEIKQIIKNGDSKSAIGIDILLKTLEEGNYVGTYYQAEVAELLEKRKELDGENRTVNGILYDTQNDAERVKSESEKLNQILKQYDLSKTTDLKIVLQQLKNSGFESKDALEKIAEIENRYVGLDEKERTVKGTVFESQEDAMVASVDNAEVKGTVFESQEDAKKALNKARLVPITVFVILAGAFSVAIAQANNIGFLNSIWFGIGGVSGPWLLFSIFKPKPATFYMTSSRFKAAGLFIGIIIITMIIGGFMTDSKKTVEAKKTDAPISVNTTNDNKKNSAQQNLENKQTKLNDEKKISFMGRIKGEDVRMRAEPSTDSKIMAVFNNKEIIQAIATINAGGREWYKVTRNNGSSGWVAKEFCVLGE